MQHNNFVPQFILERGESAREYRRRSSCISRNSNSSASQRVPSLSSPSSNGAYRDPSSAINEDDNFISGLPEEEVLVNIAADIRNYQISGNGNSETATASADGGGLKLLSTMPAYHGSKTYSLSSEDVTYLSSRYYTEPRYQRSGSLRSNRSDSSTTPRYGVARPRLVFF